MLFKGSFGGEGVSVSPCGLQCHCIVCIGGYVLSFFPFSSSFQVLFLVSDQSSAVLLASLPGHPNNFSPAMAQWIRVSSFL